jgi:hypothetical protein
MDGCANAFGEQISLSLHVKRHRRIAKIDWGKADFARVKCSNCTASDEKSA